jgi:N4-gp56 family major capsid protein
MEKLKKLFMEVADFIGFDIQHFADGGDTNKTTDSALSDEMKTFYSKYLIENAKAVLIHDQFGQTRDIPQGSGKTVEFRKYAPYPKALTPLAEGVTPAGRKLSVSTITATVSQYGDYTEISDVLKLTAIDNNILEATKLHAQQAGETLDTVTREILNGGENRQFANNQVAARYLLVGGDATETNNHYLNVEAVRRGVRNLKNNKAKKINGYYVGIIHPDTAFDLMGDDDWVAASEYAGSGQIFEGEIGKIHGVRFVETTEAKIFHAADLVAEGSTNEARTLTVAAYNNKVITIGEALSDAEATALAGRKIIIDGYLYTVASAATGAAGEATVTITEVPTHDPANGDVIYPGEAGAAGRDVYSTLLLGSDAYGITKVTGGGLETIVKQLGSAGTADALNQRATVGWKAIKTAVILVDSYMLRIETASTFESGAN